MSVDVCGLSRTVLQECGGVYDGQGFCSCLKGRLPSDASWEESEPSRAQEVQVVAGAEEAELVQGSACGSGG